MTDNCRQLPAHLISEEDKYGHKESGKEEIRRHKEERNQKVDGFHQKGQQFQTILCSEEEQHTPQCRREEEQRNQAGVLGEKINAFNCQPFYAIDGRQKGCEEVVDAQVFSVSR